ncbi:MAG: hypothetical protein GX761_02530 [Gammaproteobacteria bacterium]|nr:hypothetical protein [Gammaproteobacteria bacterium]
MNPTASSNTAAGDDPAAKELAVMRPELKLTIAGREIVMREYDFFESMEIVYEDPGFLEGCLQAFTANDARDPWEAMRPLFGKHRAFCKRAAALAAGVEVEWIEGLANPRDVDTLMSAWFSVNGHFFVHEVAVMLRGRRAKAASAGPKSSPASPPTDSAPPTASAATPPAS